MIFKHPYGVSPTLSVTIDGAAVAYDTIREVQVWLEPNLHDMVTLDLTSIPTRATADYRGRGVQVILDNGGKYVHEFDGYVVDVRPSSVTAGGTVNGSPFQDAKLVCLGVSYQMRGAKSHVWQNYHLQDVVEELATRYNLSADVPADPIGMPSMMQDNESDWQFLVRFSKALGYAVTLHGTHIHVFDPHKAASRQISYHKLRSGADVNATIAPHPGNIATFKACLTDAHPDGVYKDSIVTVHQQDGTLFDVSLREMRGLKAPAKFSDRLSESVYTYAQAERTLSAHSKKTYDFSADVETLGVAGCKPGGVVTIDRYNSEADGLWYVNSVKHKLNTAMFTTELGLLRNINSELVDSTPVAQFRPPPVARMLHGVWSTSRRIVNVYS